MHADKKAEKHARAGRQAGAGAAQRTASGAARRAGAGAKLGERAIEVNGMPVALTVKRIKNVNLRVKPDGSIAVSAPPWVSDAQIASFVTEKQGWIEARRQAHAASPYGLAHEATPDEVLAWRAAVKAAVPSLVATWEPVMGVRAGKLAYRNMTSRWGSCNPKTGRICINVQLAKYPPECLEYVVVHELCHLLERGHGPRFKALMDAYLPDWRERRAKLRG
ncbi:M48 family metallopeptidase [Raoultibacter phocaeensis]|uniref:M48 family metallopeptidase n=1 Tax=Raoultibacter phocaeensis TaxID=2479841 RepID=UPI00111AE2EB|nr:SprT family zinc-dependent metalloprotease [Raoultibacter phocaeensis]